ncbi:HET-domain-containing protein [Daldinia vernicosa]|uniref:HET-domain-containing protein n=1 Tax=Daldinia vernicosa TaxID=114800 RepID=UPI002007D217|nr:HET-domain-containing protein [Daldinia vernicosa]KAI0847751.1 HET-domain-containing protein [Daldinia vernicosa]
MDYKYSGRTSIRVWAPQETTITEDKPGGGSVPVIQLRQAGLRPRIRPYVTSANINGTPFAKYISPSNIFPTKWTYIDQLFGSSSKWAQNQISDCLNSHGECRRISEDVSFTPSRLINVSISELGGDVVLEDDTSISPGSEYVALSYCWGGYDPDCMTTADSLEENMRRIPWSKLPETFKDAVRFTRSLGINYLWIDSICIVQHDKRDWHRQAGLMWDIYKHSHVTLVALYGSSSKSGLRSTSMENEVTKVVEFSLDQHRWPLYARLPHYLEFSLDPDSSKEIEKRSPLLSRAWAYQERMVSPKVLYFTESEIIFQCYSHTNCECGIFRNRGLTVGKPSSIFWDDHRFKNGSQGTPVTTEENQGVWEWVAGTWRRYIVKEYSGLLVTKPEDRLAALGAMAKQFQKLRPNETYLVGLWSGSLIEDLSWKCSDLPLKENRRGWKDTLKRPYSLPTWSWASLQSGVDFPRRILPIGREVVAAVSEASCDYEGHSSLGLLTKSVLKLRGKLTPGMHFYSSTRIYHEKVHMDHDDDGYQCIPQQQKVYLFWMFADFRVSSQERTTRYYLILRREEEDKNIFSRAGVVEYTTTINENTWNMIDTSKTYEDAWRMLDKHSVMTECEIR